MKDIELWLGDCIELMKNIPSNKVNLVFSDLPYGTTSCAWDIVIPFDKLWEQLYRVGKDDCIYLFTSTQPFTSYLVQSNLDLWRYELVWEKTRNSHPFFAKKRPLPQHETIQFFSKSTKQVYNPQKILSEKEYIINKNTSGRTSGERKGKKWNGEYIKAKERYPHSVIKISNPSLEMGFHPTQKPVALAEYLIRTYSNSDALILDPTMGSGSTGIACKNTGRRFIGIEKEKKYFDIAVKRINE